MGILIGITGGIAAYKIPHLCRLLVKQGIEVKTVLSKSAQAFVTPLTLQAITNATVYTDESVEAQNHMDHIELARWADKILIAPLSANRLAALAHGFADDLLTTLCLASQAPLYVAPGMNEKMWAHPATQANVTILKQRGVHFLGPDFGEQACGDMGWGRMLEPENMVNALLSEAETAQRFQGLTVMVTAGPTQEAIDPVRYISNRSSGKMGYAIAAQAKAMGAKVILVSGPCALSTPAGVKRIDVTTAEQMMNAVIAEINTVDIFVSAAAVADFRINAAAEKIKQQETWSLTLTRNVDILAEIAQRSQRPFCVGFAAETQNGPENALDKLKRKKLDLIVLNDVKRQDIGFDVDENEVLVLSEQHRFPIAKNSKTAVASQLLNIIGDCYDANYKIKNIR